MDTVLSEIIKKRTPPGSCRGGIFLCRVLTGYKNRREAAEVCSKLIFRGLMNSHNTLQFLQCIHGYQEQPLLCSTWGNRNATQGIGLHLDLLWLFQKILRIDLREASAPPASYAVVYLLLWCGEQGWHRRIYFSLVFPLRFLVFRLPPAEYQQCSLIWEDVAVGLRALLCTTIWLSISGLRDASSPVLLCPCGNSSIGRNAKKLS